MAFHCYDVVMGTGLIVFAEYNCTEHCAAGRVWFIHQTLLLYALVTLIIGNAIGHTHNGTAYQTCGVSVDIWTIYHPGAQIIMITGTSLFYYC